MLSVINAIKLCTSSLTIATATEVIHGYYNSYVLATGKKYQRPSVRTQALSTYIFGFMLFGYSEYIAVLICALGIPNELRAVQLHQ